MKPKDFYHAALRENTGNAYALYQESSNISNHLQPVLISTEPQFCVNLGDQICTEALGT